MGEVGFGEIIFVLVGSATTLVGVALGPTVSYFLGKRATRRDANYLAICVVAALDRFAIMCCDAACDEGMTNKDDYRLTTTDAPILCLPEDVNWQSIHHERMYEVLLLPNALSIVEHTLNSTRDISDPPNYDEYFSARTIEYGKLGIRSLIAADNLRKEYKIPAEPNKWNYPRGSLERALEREQQRLDDMYSAQARSVTNTI